MTPWPTELRLNPAKDALTVSFDTGERFVLPAEYLRVESPSAEVQGHSPEQKQVVTGKQHVKITAIDPIGNYAVRITFDDGHDTGLYSWDWLHMLGSGMQTVWADYLASQGRR
ncbi:MAG TPA: DUF971 domain-containing protein [Rhizomicrobium sp.]|nr:DUF971 domain-containing protein [Rhizomicrobium sp.]